jgi:hypothetical protein
LHFSGKVLDRIIGWLRREFESVFEDGSGKLKEHQGKVHTYLGMTLDFSRKYQVKISMVTFVKELIAAWEKAAPKFDDESLRKVQAKRRQKKKTSAGPDNLSRSMRILRSWDHCRQRRFITSWPRLCIW